MATDFDKALCENFPVLLVVCQVITETYELEDEERVALFVTITEILKLHNGLIRFVSFVTNVECKKSDPTTLFRETGVLVMIGRALYSSNSAVTFMRPIVKDVFDTINGKMREEQEEVSLFSFLSEEKAPVREVASIALDFERAKNCPRILRSFFQTVYSIIIQRHPGMEYKTLANFYFLRFLVPRLLNPR